MPPFLDGHEQAAEAELSFLGRHLARADRPAAAAASGGFGELGASPASGPRRGGAA